MKSRKWSKLAAAAAVVLQFQQACGGDATGPGSAVAATRLFLATAPSPSAASRSILVTQPVIALNDAGGNSVLQAGTVVTASISGGGGVLAGTVTATTGSNGTASFSNLSIGGTVGPQTLSFSAAGLAGVSATVNLTPGTATTIVANAGNNQSVTVGSAVVTRPSVRITDADGNAVGGQVVIFAVASGGGSIAGENATSGLDGVATVGTWTLGNAIGANTITASATGLTGSPVTFTATGTAEAAASVAINAGNSQTAPASSEVPIAPSVRVTGASGNGVSGVTITFAVASGGGSAAGASQTTNAAGVATLGNWTLGAAPGINTLTATAAGLSGSPVTFTATGTAQPAASISINSGNNQIANVGLAVIPPSVKVTDASGNGVSGVSVTFAIGSGGGSITGASQTTSANGIATIGSWSVGLVAGTNTLTATTPGLTGSPVLFTATAVSPGQNLQGGADRSPVTTTRLAVFVIDFADTPQAIKDNYFPSISALRDTIFNGQIQSYFSDMSYGQFTITGDVFGYFTHQSPGFVNGAVTEMPDVVNISTINIPGFDISRYDGVLFVSINDAGLAGGRGGVPAFKVNGVTYNKNGLFVPIHIGYYRRDAAQYPTLINTLRDPETYDIPTGTNAGVGNFVLPSTIPFSRFNRTFSHELVHYLGITLHATSKTNGASYDYEPEVTNNNCRCYSDPLLGSLLDLDYGNNFDVMGHSTFGMSLNTVFRDFFGWTNANTRQSIKDYGHFTATINPVNHGAGVRTVEIRIPLEFASNGFGGSKNKGYFLEVRRGSNKWDNMLSHVQLQGNNDGIMVLKTDGFNSQLLDMSPSANISYFGQVVPDIRDVVLKPGMTYENKQIRLGNVRKNGDGSFTVDVDVLRP